MFNPPCEQCRSGPPLFILLLYFMFLPLQKNNPSWLFHALALFERRETETQPRQHNSETPRVKDGERRHIAWIQKSTIWFVISLGFYLHFLYLTSKWTLLPHCLTACRKCCINRRCAGILQRDLSRRRWAGVMAAMCQSRVLLLKKSLVVHQKRLFNNSLQKKMMEGRIRHWQCNLNLKWRLSLFSFVPHACD